MKQFSLFFLMVAAYSSSLASDGWPYSLIKSTDSVMTDSEIDWTVSTGITMNDARGLTLNTSLRYALNDDFGVRSTLGLSSFRGPAFAYRTERYFNSGSGYGYDINEVLLSDYVGTQLVLALDYREPFFKVFNVSVGPYYMRKLSSSSLKKTNWQGNGFSSSRSGSDGSSSKTVYIGGTNYGFPSINPNDFGLQYGIGASYRRWAFHFHQNIGFIDWGDDNRFGDIKETASFSSIQLGYTILKR